MITNGLSPNMRYYIETDRLLMRDLLAADAEGMYELDSDPDVHRYVGRNPVTTIERSREIIDIIRTQYDTNGIGRWAVIEKSTGNFIGWSGLKLMTELTNGHINYLDVGYRFIKRYWGQGYAKETARAAVDYAWHALGAADVYGMADVENVASCKVLESTGMQLIEHFLFEGDMHAWYRLQRPASLPLSQPK